MSKTIGYMEGVDPIWLTTLQAQGYSTMPLGNGIDSYGLNIRLLTEHNRPDLIISYLHKLIPPEGADVPAEELLLMARLYEIPVLVVCPKELHPQATELLARVGGHVDLVDPVEVLAQAYAHLK
jgi:hypothetical protein